MNLDDFENKFRESDPAMGMSPAQAHHHDHVIEQAMSADTSHVVPISRWTTRRKAATSAAAALLVGGLLAPTISGSMVAGGPERLVFNAAAFNAAAQGTGAGNQAPTADGKMSGMSMMPYWYYNMKYVADGSFSSNTSTANGYEVVTMANAADVIKKIASSLGVAGLTYDDSMKSWVNGTDRAALIQFYGSDASAGTSAGSFNYYNQQLDPWFKCYNGSDVKGGGATEPGSPSAPEPQPACTPDIPTNLPTNAEAEQLVRQWLNKWGLETTNLKFDIYSGDGTDRYSVSVGATVIVDGFASPISTWFNFVGDGKIQSVGGSLLELKNIGVYDLIAPNAVIDRLVAMNAAQQAAYEKWAAENNMGTGSVTPVPATDTPIAVDPTATSASGGSGSTGTATAQPAPSATSVGPIDPNPVPTEMVIHVTRIERTMVSAYLADGRFVWLPGFELWGYQEGSSDKTAYQMNSVVGIVDSQIDLQSLYNWGPMVAMGGIAVR